MRRILIAQGGGPTAVINETLVGIVLKSVLSGAQVIYGARHGAVGILKEELVNLTNVPVEELERIAATPSAALGSTRSKPDEESCREIFRVLQAHGITHFFDIGGDGTADRLRIVGDEARRANYQLSCVHVPKTVDNDLMGNHFTPGYPSGARFVALAFTGINLDNIAIPGIHVVVVMGRHAGFLTAASALARSNPDDGPHLIYLPERTFILDRFLEDVRRVYDRHGRCVIAVSEGIHDASGIPLAATIGSGSTHEKDTHGNTPLSGTGALGDFLCKQIKKAGVKRVRADTLGYPQRSFLGCVSELDRRIAREVGQAAVGFALSQAGDMSIIIRQSQGGIGYGFVQPDVVAAKTRVMADEFIATSGTDVTQAFIGYVRPLVGDLPNVHRLLAPSVEKILKM